MGGCWRLERDRQKSGGQEPVFRQSGFILDKEASYGGGHLRMFLKDKRNGQTGLWCHLGEIVHLGLTHSEREWIAHSEWEWIPN